MDGTSIVAIIGAVLGLIGIVYTQRTVGAASRRATEIESDKVDLQRVEGLRKDIDDLRRWRSEDRAAHHAEIGTLRTEHAAEIGGLRERLARLEQELEREQAERAADRTRLEAFTIYARALLRLLRDNGIAHPPPPDGLDTP